jgi:radical SAM protein with 4Fe4S-binding SPASM domain
MTVTPARAHCLYDDLAYLHGLGFRQISFLPASGMPWDTEARRRLEVELDRVADSFAGSVIEGSSILPYYPPILRRLSVLWTEARRGHRPRTSGSCGAGTTLVAVDTTGDLYPCHRFIGQPRPATAMRLGTIDQGITNRELRGRLAAFSMDTAEVPCATCASRSRCLSACLARNYQSTGDLYRPPEEACFVQLSLARAAERIHGRLLGNPRYEDYIRPYIAADPDERVLDWIATLGSDEGRLLDRITKELRGSDPATEEEG